MGSRALSHDSIFLADQVLTDAEPARVLSQENVHSKIKALQIKLQKQKMHFGPPPMVCPIRRPDDAGGHLEHSPYDIPEGGILVEMTSQPTSQPLYSSPNPAPAKSLPPTPSNSYPLSVPSNSLSSSSVEAPLDFSTPAQFSPCLDTSAARHRMSVKPKNQRAGTKKKPDVTQSKSHTDILNNIDHPESEKEQELLCVQEEATMTAEEGRINIPVVTYVSPLFKPAEVAQVTLEATPKSSSLSFPQQDLDFPAILTPPSSPIFPRVRLRRGVDAGYNERPHSSFIESELKNKTEGEIQVTFHYKKSTLNKDEASPDQLPAAPTSMAAFRSSSLRQVEVEGESMRGFKRSAPGSGSFHLSVNTSPNQDSERPRSGSFIGVLGHTETKHKTIEAVEEKSLKEREEFRSVQLRASPFSLRRLGQDATPPATPVVPWERKDSLKKVESDEPSKNVPPGGVEGGELESSQEEVEEAVEAKEVQEVQEEDGKTAFGVKLRSTSQSIRLRSDSATDRNAKTVEQKRLKISDNASSVCERLPANMVSTTSTTEEVRPTGLVPSDFHVPIKDNAPIDSSPPVMPAEVPMASTNPREAESKPQEPQPAPQTAPSEVSWMSLAMEKTRSLQQLFTSRFPRDFTSNAQTNTQTPGRTQAQVQSTSQTETAAQVLTQTVKMQQSATPVQAANQRPGETKKAETVPSQVQTVKPSPVAGQQKMSVTTPVQSNTSKEQQTSRQSSEDQSITSQSVSQSVRTVPWTTQSRFRSSSQPETTSQFAQGNTTQSPPKSHLPSGQQQPPWSNRDLQPTNQLKSTTSASVSAVTSTATPPPASAFGSLERETPVRKESNSIRRAVWAGSLSERAVFLERAQGTMAPGPKGVELRKVQTEMQASDEASALTGTSPQSKDTTPEGRQGVKLAESSPTKVPERPREDKWQRKNTVASSLPSSSSPTLPSVLQSMSDSGQPSWMELAKRKSMAWSDKTMD
ncbi:mucin-5AC isoform X2 [Mugil cephalus]|nr:mucin-5AC isoform X2 [Mugil cephalus]